MRSSVPCPVEVRALRMTGNSAVIIACISACPVFTVVGAPFPIGKRVSPYVGRCEVGVFVSIDWREQRT